MAKPTKQTASPASPIPPGQNLGQMVQMTLAEWMGFLQRFSDLEREVAGLRERKMDFKWGVIAGASLAGFILVAMFLQFAELRGLIIENGKAIARLEAKSSGDTESVNDGENPQPAVYYPTHYPSSP